MSLYDAGPPEAPRPTTWPFVRGPYILTAKIQHLDTYVQVVGRCVPPSIELKFNENRSEFFPRWPPSRRLRSIRKDTVGNSVSSD